VKLRFDYSDEELIFLMRHDSDGFSRWDAAQNLMQRLLLSMTQNPATVVSPSFVDAFRTALSDLRTDQALMAEVLTLPSESYLGDQMEVVDVEGIHRARTGLKRAIGEQLAEDLLAVYRANHDDGPYGVTPEEIGRRAIKNLALSYLAAVGDGTAIKLCRAQFADAANMTDSLAALRMLVDYGDVEGPKALDVFYRRWSKEPLVIDKWFSVQATSSRDGALDAVCDLMRHPDFSLRNPNRVRSLVGAFCAANPARFHAADGSGYRFLADRVLELDPLNPQIAARLLKSLIRWRRYDPGRQALMRAQIERVMEADQLSSDAFEVASKALEDAEDPAIRH
jgi:aminopeptidase N